MKEWFTFRLTHYSLSRELRVFVPMKTTQCKIIKTRWHCLVANTLLIICMAFIIRATHFKKEKWSIKHYLINCWKRWLFDVSTTFYFKFYVIRPPSQGYFMLVHCRIFSLLLPLAPCRSIFICRFFYYCCICLSYFNEIIFNKWHQSGHIIGN